MPSHYEDGGFLGKGAEIARKARRPFDLALVELPLAGLKQAGQAIGGLASTGEKVLEAATGRRKPPPPKRAEALPVKTKPTPKKKKGRLAPKKTMGVAPESIPDFGYDKNSGDIMVQVKYPDGTTGWKTTGINHTFEGRAQGANLTPEQRKVGTEIGRAYFKNMKPNQRKRLLQTSFSDIATRGRAEPQTLAEKWESYRSRLPASYNTMPENAPELQRAYQLFLQENAPARPKEFDVLPGMKGEGLTPGTPSRLFEKGTGEIIDPGDGGSAKSVTAINAAGDRVISYDGGVTWQPLGR